ncbi:MBOAT family O-acyltransferase [Algoriphagus aquatilis]|uniref:MBOAT family O-acyltransferase n=1 Tax=Algoriphagus aquatilis TaxID=490186 RepID=A0ABW0BTH4_9BACT
MLFNSWEFVGFFLVVLGLFFSLPHRFRIYLLLSASYYFYMSWRWEFGFLMLAVSLSNFYVGRQVAKGKNKGWWMVLTSTISVLPLLYYKYGNFILDSVGDLSGMFGKPTDFPELQVILPVGISFFTFQALSYSIDIYRGKIQPEPSVVKFLTFVAFFPQLVAGPIERTDHIIPQFDREKKFDLSEAVAGMKIFVWGLFKKVVIADRLAMYSDTVFTNPDSHTGPTLALGTIFFTFQIYCDFSGYSDMAVGIARVFGFRLMQNFNLPYLSSSIAEFWKRWHISLSSWFGDYLYIPLGGNRVSVPRWIANIFIVFLVSGLWHGANWTFVVWGGLHASYYLLEYIGTQSLNLLGLSHWIKSLVYRWIKVPVVFLLVAFAWIFFRANSLDQAFLIIGKIAAWQGSVWWGSSAITSLLSLALIGLLIAVMLLQAKGWIGIYYQKSKAPSWVSFIAFLGLLLGISLFGVSSNAFIYFQF